jgi:PAS domain S-box-containing protein
MDQTLQTVTAWRLDAIAFGVLVVTATAVVHLRLCRRGAQGVSALAWLLLIGLALAGAVAAEIGGRLERHRLRTMLEGIAPTYAQELEQMGHARVTSDTPADDERYLNMIAAQIRWERVNRQVSDIYTFRKGADGQVVFVVDSETDYDRNGRFEGDRESRTAIGEAYPETTPAMLEAFGGTATFDDEPMGDRWGVWVSAYAPMRNAAGAVDAVLGVDYDARQWVWAILRNRSAALGFVGIAAVILIASIALIQVSRAEIAKRRVAEQAARDSEARLRTILDSEPEIVLLTDERGRIVQINPAGVTALGGASAEALAGAPFSDHVTVAHRQAYARWHDAACHGQAGALEFQINSPSGGARWLDGRTVPLRDVSGNSSA